MWLTRDRTKTWTQIFWFPYPVFLKPGFWILSIVLTTVLCSMLHVKLFLATDQTILLFFKYTFFFFFLQTQPFKTCFKIETLNFCVWAFLQKRSTLQSWSLIFHFAQSLSTALQISLHEFSLLHTWHLFSWAVTIYNGAKTPHLKWMLLPNTSFQFIASLTNPKLTSLQIDN